MINTDTRSKHSIGRLTLLIALPLLLVSACQSTYYNAWEKLGVHKRDILVDRVEEARDAQEDAQEQFSSALEEFSSLVKFDGGDIETYYKRLNNEYEASREAADEVSSRIDSIDSVAHALFKEWEQEIEQYSNASFKNESRSQLRDTKTRYAALEKSMRRAESTMEPVLATMRDNVLMLKHSLNARAIGALREEYQSIKRDIDALIGEMNDSIERSNQFIASMQ